MLNPADAASSSGWPRRSARAACVPPEPRYLEEPRGRFAGRAAAVLRPDLTAAVAAAVPICAEARVGIVPYSGGTGLVGGQVLSEGPLPVILSFERMNRIRDLDLVDGVLSAEAGCILADVQAAALEAGRLFPLTLASEGSARIGGLLGTNAGGVHVIRYGNARDLCLGVEAVLADGSVRARPQPGGEGQHGLRPPPPADRLGGNARAHHRREPPAATRCSPRPRPPGSRSPRPRRRSRCSAACARRSAARSPPSSSSASRASSSSPRCCPQVPQPPAMAGDWRVLVESGRRRRRGDGRARLETALAAALEAGVADDVLHRPERRPARGLLAGARDDPGGEPADRRDLEPRHLGAAVAPRRVHRPRRPGGRRARTRTPDQLLRAPRRRQPALQRLPARGAAAATAYDPLREPVKRDGARPRPRARRLGRGGARRRPAQGRRSRALRRPGQARGDARDQDAPSIPGASSTRALLG